MPAGVAHVSSAVGLSNVPEAIRSHATLPSPDYVDLFTLTTSDARLRSAEQWARAALEDAPAARHFAFIPWRVLLQLRLGPSRSPHYVHGWKISDRGDDWIRIEAASWFMTCQAVVHVEDDRVSVALFVRYDRPLGALVWPALSKGHRRAMHVILHQAVKTGSGWA